MEKEDTAANVADALPRIPPPLIVDLGPKSKKAIRKLKNGRGKLMFEVDQVIEQARSRLPDDLKNRPIITVLVIYRKKAKRGKRGSLPCFPLSPFSLFR